MKIRFKKGDPREGMVAEFNTNRGQELIDAGSAVEFKGELPELEPERAVEVQKPTAKKAAKKAD